jgi:chemotaxis-related protein WspD
MTSLESIDDCWRRIGVEGDGSCPELVRVLHCRNCEVFARAGRQLLEQAPPAAYLERWAAQLAAPSASDDGQTLSTVVFRLAGERLALPTTAFVEAIDVRPIHRVPHRSNAVFLGLANVRGELQLCVSLAALLSIEPAGGDRASRPRFAVIERAGERWVFPVDELLGVHRVAQEALAAPPATVSGGGRGLTSALFELAGARVALLDPDLVCARLRRALA